MRGYLALWCVSAVVVCGGCRGLLPFSAANREAPRPTLPGDYELPAGQLVFRSDFELSGRDRLVCELTEERDDVCETLNLPPSDNPITIFLFRDAKTYSEFLAARFPGVPPRRAFFVENDSKLQVYAHFSDRIAEDLRHEVAHAYLHGITPGLPLWLDEGLAEYFEMPRGRGGRNDPHIALLSDLAEHNGWQADLARLERLTHTAEMDQQNYAEAWAWAYFLLESTPERRKLLTDYLGELHARRGAVEPLAARLRKQSTAPEQEMGEYLAALNRTTAN
jgi:hypothetical protein